MTLDTDNVAVIERLSIPPNQIKARFFLGSLETLQMHPALNNCSATELNRHSSRRVSFSSAKYRVCRPLLHTILGFGLAVPILADTNWISTSSTSYITAGNWSNGLPSTGPQLGIFPDSETIQHTIDITGTFGRNAVGLQFPNYTGPGSAGFVFGSSANNSPGFQNRTSNIAGSGASLLNDDDNTQTFNVPYTMFSATGIAGATAAQMFLARNGGLVFSGIMTTRSTINNNGGLLTLDGGFDITIGNDGAVQGDIVGGGGLTKNGTGTLTLGGSLANPYSGPTTLNNGSIVLRKPNALGNAAATNTLTLNSPAVLNIQNHAQSVGAFTLAGGTLEGTAALTAPSYLLESGMINAPLAGSGDLTKATSGTAGIDSTSTYSGATIISEGVLLVTGILNGTSQVDIAGTLAGDGSLTLAAGGNISLLAGGKLSPGTSIGTLEANLSAGGEFDISGGIAAAASQSLFFELGAPGVSDLVDISGGALDIGLSLLEFDDFTFTALGGFDQGTYVLFQSETPILGSLGPNTAGDIGGVAAELQIANGGRDLVVVVPEPGSAALLMGGMALLFLRRGRKAA